MSILEGDAAAFRIRDEGDVFTAPLREVVDASEPREALARLLARSP